MPPRDPHSVLGVPKDACANDIKRAYKRKAAVCHPDRGGSRADWDELQRAYFQLTGHNSERSEPIRGAGFTIPIEQIIPVIDAGITGIADLLRKKTGSVGAGTWWGEAARRASSALIQEAENAAKNKVIGDLRNAKRSQ